MKTILSIDLDILMSPYCGIYNKYIIGDSADLSWANIKADIFTADKFCINENYYALVSKIINHYQNQIDKVYIGKTHGLILTALEYENVGLTDLQIYNIDYHHDINYKIVNPIEQEFKNHAVNSWAGYLMLYNNRYNWYQGVGSELSKKFFLNQSALKLGNNFNQFLFDENFPLNLDIDLFYITPSWPWIPSSCYGQVNQLLNQININKLVQIEE